MHKHILTCCLSVLVLAGWAATATTAQAATQALALVANDVPAPLRCLGAECSAEFSTFCLQPERASPTKGTVYHLAAADSVRLVGHGKDGRELSLDPTEHLRITALRTHVAVRLTVPSRIIEELGLRDIAVTVGWNASLLPAATSPEPDRQSAAEIATLTGPVRALGSDFVDRDGERMVAARIASRMINILPTSEQTAPEDRAGLWPAAVQSRDFAEASPIARDLARQTHDTCLQGATSGLFPSMRQCLQSHHDMLVGDLNTTFWEALKTGS